MVDFQRNVFCLLGLPFDAVDMAHVLQRVRDFAVKRTPCLISTPNTNWVVSCLVDGQFRDAVIRSDLSVVDGMPLVWIARLLGVPIRERVAGSTIFEQLRGGTGRQLSVFFFGGAEGVAEAACGRLRTECRGLTCAGFESAGFGSIEEMSGDEVIQRINASGADFLIVALGARKGQAWIERNRARISVPLISHLGAVLNFAAGTVKRAPSWLGNLGLEWLWRIKEEPALWARYFQDGLALIKLLATRVLPHAWYLHQSMPDAESLANARVETRDEQDACVLSLSGPWTWKNIGPLRECLASAVSAGKGVTLDVRAVTFVDSAFVGLAVLLQGFQKQRGRAFLVAAPPQTVRRVIRYCCADYLLVSHGTAGRPG